MGGERCMVPEKGRNAGVALERELRDEQCDVEWLRRLINGVGKRAAKSGDGHDELRRRVGRIRSDEEALQVKMKDLGRLNPRPVLERLELDGRRIEGYETPRVAWRREVARFYAGLDCVIDDLLRRGTSLDGGFETTVREAMSQRGYRLTETMGDEVKWAAMYRGSRIPDEPDRVLVPADFVRLGSTLVERYWGREYPVRTFESYARARRISTPEGEVPAREEERILARAEDGVAGVYMFVSGSTAERNGLTYDRIEGAVSELGRFEADRRS